MDSSDPHHRRNQSTPQSIPLQDFSRQQDTGDEEYGSGSQRRRSLGERGRNLFNRNRDSISGRPRHNNARYAAIQEDSESRSRGSRAPRLVTEEDHLTSPRQEYEDYSPLEDISGFQSAIGGFAGLTFQGESSYTPPLSQRPVPRGRGTSESFSSQREIDPYANDHAKGHDYGYSSPIDEDTTPLTDPGHLQPISGAVADESTYDRTSNFQSVRFLAPEHASSSDRRSEDMRDVEVGLSPTSALGRSGSRQRSLSPTSPLQRASTIMRNMSMRVVNISNEQDVVERSIKRKSSVKTETPQEPEARLQAPPSFPAMTEYAHDGGTSPPIEKSSSGSSRQINVNPLRGRSLGIFSADNPIRVRLCSLLVHPLFEPCIFVLIVVQTVLLAADSRRNVYNDGNSEHSSNRWGSSWIDYGVLSLFILYTIELLIRIIVSGLLINPVEYSTVNRKVGLKQAIMNKGHELFAITRQPSLKRAGSSFEPSIIRTFTMAQTDPDQPKDARQRQRIRLAHRAFLRHSFNRLDFLAVIAFWISFAMSITGIESRKHAYLFRMLSCLRILRLLNMTSGTTVILRSLKKAAPLLVNVAFLICYFWLLFAIVGVQSFKASLRRHCVWTDPLGVELDQFDNENQFCGGFRDNVTGDARAWIRKDGTNNTGTPKGYLCPRNSICLEGHNPYNGTVSFDNIFQSFELVFVVMSSNTWSDLMYKLVDSEYLVAALFFAIGILLLSLWLISLLVAVITSSFQVIREESKTSAFTGQDSEPVPGISDEQPKIRPSALKRFYERTDWIWILVIAYGLVCQCLRSASMGQGRETFINVSETGVTIILFAEIIIRFVIDWRHFHRSKQNLVDAAIAIITMVIQLPTVKHSHDGRAYAWLTVFQIMRIYRVVLAVPMTRELIMVVLGNVSGLLNLILFVFLLTFLGAIFATQLLRGDIPEEDGNGETIRYNFFSMYNSFLAMYTILSSENWTTVLYTVTTFNRIHNTAWIGAAFFIIWFILANFIVLNMFIAVIQENFDVSEDEKRLQQVKAFLQRKEIGHSGGGNLSLSTIFKFGQHTGRRKDPLDFGSAATEMLLKDAVVKDFLDEPETSAIPRMDTRPTLRAAPTIPLVNSGSLSALWANIIGRFKNREPNPFYESLGLTKAQEELDPREMAKHVVDATERRKLAQRQYLQKHPKYNVSLFIFQPDNWLRRACQRIVGPGRGGTRIQGVDPSTPVWYAFSAFIYAAIIAMVILACVTTPLYQREYFLKHTFSVKNWFVFSDMGFAAVFTIEALIKVIADGFFWTPNAYFRGSWGFIDGVVLLTLWINIITSLDNEGQISRVVGAFKALRALRLLNVSDSARDTFHSLIVRGWWKLTSAAFVSLSLLIPFAMYGLNLFNGRLQSCNDGKSNIRDLNDCVGEYMSTPYNWTVLAPRQASNPSYDFDNFGNSLFILFQIVSQEGWTDVMWSAESITGVFTQPSSFSQEGNAVFFVVFNLLGAVFVLTLFVSVFMRNYTEQTGVAFLTSEQRSWLELRKLLRQISPSKRPTAKKRQTWAEWCYHRAVRKSGRWQRFITVVLVLHVVLLCTEYYPGVLLWDRVRDLIFLFFVFIYTANIIIRIVGLTWTRFRKSSWDLFSLVAVTAALVTSILLLSNLHNRTYTQLHKFSLVGIALLIIPRNNALDQLFKTAAASLPSIANLLATWFVLFLVYAIALSQTFGLTRFGENESNNVNFRTVPKALILLFRTSIGEGWNALMEDFASIKPPYCTIGERYFESDCGSPEWARFLFISWNILSMYIFVNLFVSLIYESFSYVYQRSNGLSVISREEIRRFKQAWAEFDPSGTGFIPKAVLPRLLGELSGVFQMRIYDGEFTLGCILRECCVDDHRGSTLEVSDHKRPREIDLAKLNARIAQLPLAEIRMRRRRMNLFYEEVMVSADPDRGINFNALLIILAHHKVINDNKSLRLEEFLRRRARMQRVEEAVRRNIVVGFFDTLYWRRRFNSRSSGGRMTDIPQFTVPEILVEDEDITNPERRNQTPSLSPINTSFRSGSGSEHARLGDSPVGSPIGIRGRSSSIQISPSQSPTMRGISPMGAVGQESIDRPDWQFAAALSGPPSPLGGGTPEGGRSRANSNAAQDALDVFNDSAWGESIRRSFTLRRPQDRR
ncbi:calcium-channel protein CCH1 [Pseudovirgaria hyperparasitica]|uniref:Calcium-channel protein CCH1 n=1 Tax=Pseudovirgaria hyperparasitica TaxID=470096 RepID=A0A6A6WJ93_9PEZI|nr:calcium-channel protein CCH1 [Pseudovirgaria hyperparasitica]KAF2761827.1 calcium-channel protein CCH1 [Pseudovirgaria hyperparasitica]